MPGGKPAAPDPWRWPRRQAVHLAAVPAAALLGLLVLAPMLMLVYQSFSGPDGHFPVLTTYARLFRTDLYWHVLLKSIAFALEVTFVTLLVGWPAAWAMARHVPKHWQASLVAALIVPFLTSYLLLIYGMFVMLAPGGPLPSLLGALGLTSPATSILYTPAATFVMLVNESLSFAMIVLYLAGLSVRGDLIEAAESLGGGRWVVFRSVILPSCSTSLITAFILTFIPTAGVFAESQILGGPNNHLLGNIINDQINMMGDLRFGAALSLLLLIAILFTAGCFVVLPSLVSFTQRLLAQRAGPVAS